MTQQRKDLTPEDIDKIGQLQDVFNFKRNVTIAYCGLQDVLTKIHKQCSSREEKDEKKLKTFDNFLDEIEGLIPRSLVFEPKFSADRSLGEISVVLNSNPSRELCKIKLVGNKVEKL